MLLLKNLVRWLIPLAFAASMFMGHVAHAAVTEISFGKVFVSAIFESPDDIDFLLATQVDRDYHIIINSTGGRSDMFYPMRERILELQRKGFHITTEIVGTAYSAAAWLWILGDTRISHGASVVMFHKIFMGNSWGKIAEENLTEWQKHDLKFANQIARQDILNQFRSTDLANKLLGNEDYWIYGKEMINLDLCTHYIE